MESWFKEKFVPQVLPPFMRDGGNFGPEGKNYSGSDVRGKFTVIITWSEYDPGARKWVHLSIARPDRMPDWQLLRDMKNLFFGRERQAIQVLPSESVYVNIHPYCLHLWTPADDEWPIPDFGKYGTL